MSEILGALSIERKARVRFRAYVTLVCLHDVGVITHGYSHN